MSSFDVLLGMARGNVPFERIKVSGGQTEGHLKVNEEQPKKNATVDRARKGSGYARKYQLQEREEDEMEELPARGPFRMGKMMAAVEDLTSHGTCLEDPRILLDDSLRVYEEYSFDHVPDKKLPINEYKDTILAQIEANSVVIVKGPTGCGKSTQVPQYILDDARSSQIYCNIVITQPRRIAATSVAKRVCEERGWNLGTIVGYQIGLEKRATDDTRLLYCTAGVLLQQLIGSHRLSMYTHIIIDEVHERDSETDFLLIVIKKLMRMRGNRTKLILMSATITTDKFVDYFSKVTENIPIRPPVIELDQSEKRFPVQEYYLDSLTSLCVVNDVTISEPKIFPSMYQLVSILLGVFATIESSDRKNKSFLGSVLIFLPGIQEIDTMYSILHTANSVKSSSTNTSGKQQETWILCPLHSTMSFDEQMKVFMQPPTGQRKIILATNIAESSITVADVRYVIDFCLTKHQVQDKDTFYSALQLSWVSKSQAKQRSGRVGRTGPGRVYRLIPESMYKELEEDCTPEILRCPLDQLVLKAKKLDFGPPVSILGSAMDPPDLTNIQRTILNLKEVGALTLMMNGEYDEEDGEMTFIGTVMESLPLDIQLSKLILVGHMLNILRECVQMACCMSGKNIFHNPLKQKLDAFNSRVAWAGGSASDPLTYLFVYQVWKTHSARGQYARSGGPSEQQFASRNFLNLKALKEVERMENEVITRLDRLGIKNSNKEKEDLTCILLKIAIAGAFYPNYFIHCPIDEKEAVKTLGGRDPYRTVYLMKFPQNQPGPLYRDSIKKLFEHCGSNIKVQFDGSAKVYIEFGDSFGCDSKDAPFGTNRLKNEEAAPSTVMRAVYRAVKLKQLNMPMRIPMLPAPEADKRAKEIFGDSLSTNVFCWQKIKARPQMKKTIMPGLSICHITLSITHINDPHNFYVWLSDGYDQKCEWIDDGLNSGENELVDLDDNAIIPDLLCVAPYADRNEPPRNYRAKVQKVYDFEAKVMYVDYGNVGLVKKSNIKGYGPALIEKGIREEPSRCIKCRLAEVQPVGYKQDQSGGWSSEAIEDFIGQFKGKKGYAKIYSTVNDTMALYLFRQNVTAVASKHKVPNEDSCNHHLVNSNFALFVEEPYLSKENHALREKVIESSDLCPNYSTVDEHQNFLDELEFKSPTEKETHLVMNLLGPKSPLEMSISSITRKCVGKAASVEFNSVNSVLLDTNPMDTSSRLVVAGTVTQSYQGDRLTLRNTTIMPSIRGIVGLMCLIFTPKAELRVDPTRSYITGALCGLGCDERGLSYDQENDIEVAFDCKFSLDDIVTINKIRYWMNNIICGAAATPQEQAVSEPAAHSAQGRIIKYLLSLFSITRDPLYPTSYDNSYEWNQIPDEYLLEPTTQDKRLLIYSLIWGVKLRESTEAQTESLKKNLKKLNEYAEGAMKNTINCELCQVYFELPQAVALHLKTAVHKIRENRLFGTTMEGSDVSSNYQ